MIYNPFITVLVLCYNGSAYLNHALNALAIQTFRDFEIVFINNGSTDNSLDIFKSFAKGHRELHLDYISVYPNQGPTHGWNEGLKHVHGKYVLFHDADDWMDSDCLEKLAKKAQDTGADRITCQYREVDDAGRVIRERRIVSTESKRLPSAMLQGVLFRYSVIADNRLCFPEKKNLIAYDFEMVYRFAALEKKSGDIVQSTHYNYLIHSDSTIQKSAVADKSLKYYNTVTIPLIDITAEITNKISDCDLSDRMIYLLLRNHYSRLLSLHTMNDVNEQVCKNMKEYLETKLPGYKHNRYLKPFNNGYEQPGTFATWVIYLLDSVKLLNVLGRVFFRFAHYTKYLR